jgi:hypothetical protein
MKAENDETKDYQWQLGLLGEILPFKEALELFHQLSDWIDTRSDEECIPMALVVQGDQGKVITHPSEQGEWEAVIGNAMFFGNKVILVAPQEH